MANWNIGSISTHVGGIVGWSNISAISGTILNDMVLQEINFAETYTTVSIGSSVASTYQPAIIDLTLSKVLLSVEAQQGGIDQASLGELSVSQAQGGGAELARQLREDAIARLKELQRTVRYTRVIGV